MKISIVTAVWNRACTIGEAIESVQRQSYGNIEHVIQDGGSTDGTLQVIERLANNRTRLVSQRDSGIYDAINIGISRATGDVIGLMHSDDMFTTDGVLCDVATAFVDRKVDGVYGDLQYISATDPDRVIRYWRSGAYDPSKLKRGWMPPHPTLYLRREVFERWGAYDTSFRISADYDAMLRWFANDIRLAYVPKVLVKMRLGGESNASIGSILRKSREDYRAIRRNRIGGLRTLALKNLRKIEQFTRKDVVS